MRILLVEDEERLADALEYILKKQNYLLDIAGNGLDGQDMAETGIYDLIILDRMLPGKEGVAVLKSLRQQGIKTPVIFLTAKDTVACKVEGLDAGADDYLIKPFSTEELLARVRALGRRSDHSLTGETIKIAALTLDPLRCEAVCGESSVKLTLKECQLLELLMRHPGQVLTKDQILERIWGYDSDAEFNNVEIYIHYLRKKISENRCGVKIQTIRGVGYCLKEA